jgi:hypothetical protein
MKVCSKCKIEKTLESFFNKMNQCKNCFKEQKKQYRSGIRDILLKKSKKYYLDNKDSISEYRKKVYKENKTIVLKSNKLYRLANKEKIKEYNKQYRIKNKEKLAEKNKLYQQNRTKNDCIYRFKRNVQSLIRCSFKRTNYHKNSKTVDILGCGIEDFKSYIQSKFKKGMSFDNSGKWHLDHIIPLATANTEEDVIRLNHYTNFQPLWAEENLKKSNKIIEKQLQLL